LFTALKNLRVKWVTCVAYCLFVLLVGIAVLAAGPVAQSDFGHDVFVVEEAGWKIVNGDRPYTDFNVLMGPLTPLIMAWGILVAGPVPMAIPISIVLSVVPLSWLTWHLFSRRLAPVWAFFGSAYVVLLWCGNFPLHFPYWDGSYAMIYNRQSYALLSVLLVALAIQPRSNPYWNGLLLALLLFFKIPYFIAGGAMMVFYYAFAGISKREGLWFLGGMATVTLPLFIFLRGLTGFGAMIAAYHLAAEARTPDVFAQSLNLFQVEYPLMGVTLILAVGCAIFSVCCSKFDSKNRRTIFLYRVQRLAEPFVVVAVALFTEMTSCPLGYFYDIPLLFIYLGIVANRLYHEITWQEFGREQLIAASGVVLCALFFFSSLARSLHGLIFPLNHRIQAPTSWGDTRIDGPGCRGLAFYRTCGRYPLGISYAGKINDGISLMKSHPELDHVFVATLDFSDAFSYALQRPPPPHMPVGLQYGFNVNERICPDPSEIFGGCQAIMVPKFPDSPEQTIYILAQRYSKYILTNYAKAGESSLWTLYIRNAVGSTASE
jgi:hypothetical protein